MSPLERHLYDLAARTAADPYFLHVPVFVMRPRYEADGSLKDTASLAAIQSRVDQALAGTLQRGGKAGVAILFLMPVADTTKPEVPGPQLRFVYTARVVENVVVNMGPAGVGLSAEEIALRLIQLLHHCSLNGAQALFADRETLTPTSERDSLLVSYDVRLAAQGQLAPLAKVARPILSAESGAVPQSITITCATASALLHYTTDGSYPSPANPAATLYTGAISVSAACTLRAAATLATYAQSDVAQGTYT